TSPTTPASSPRRCPAGTRRSDHRAALRNSVWSVPIRPWWPSCRHRNCESPPRTIGSMRQAQYALSAPFVITGTGCIAAGGLVSAVTAPVPNEASAWAVAYLVLVFGLAQVLLGCGRVLLCSASTIV